MTSPQTIASLAASLRVHHPHHADTLDDIAHLCDQIAHALPRARAVTDPGDGLRSPNLTGGGRSIGGHADTTYAAAHAHGAAQGDPRFLGPEDRPGATAPKPTALHAAQLRLRLAEDALRTALSIPTHADVEQALAQKIAERPDFGEECDSLQREIETGGPRPDAMTPAEYRLRQAGDGAAGGQPAADPAESEAATDATSERIDQ